MELTNERIDSAMKAFQRLGEFSFPPMTSLKIIKNLRVISTHFNDLEKVRVDIVKKYGTLKEGTTNEEYVVADDKLTDFNKEIDELYNSEVSIDIEVIKITTNFPAVPLNIMSTLDFMFEE
jgi:hypothetical protein